MRRAYVVVGENEKTGVPYDWYAVAHSMRRAEELCYEAEEENENPNLIYTWYEAIDEEDD